RIRGNGKRTRQIGEGTQEPFGRRFDPRRETKGSRTTEKEDRAAESEDRVVPGAIALQESPDPAPDARRRDSLAQHLHPRDPIDRGERDSPETPERGLPRRV